MNSTYWHEQRDKARVLRKSMSPEKQKLYYQFFKAESIRVRRQYVVGAYIVDFCVIQKKLIIEIEDREHLTYADLEHNEKKDRRLKACGYTVLRFDNSQIRDKFEIVCEKIEKYFFNQNS